MNKTVIVNIYNFIRMSHVEPSRFIPDDFETIRNEILTVKQYGFPGTYALKYDALMEPRYQELLKTYLDDSDEIGAWWEITSELCQRAGIRFRDSSLAEEYDDRVDSAYSIGYTPEERKKLVDAYMEDFITVFGHAPGSIGSWVLDSATLGYAQEKYGVEAACICRDQMGVDGFTLWGGYPNGIYYPSVKNEHIPAQRVEQQLNMPVFRLLGPDPIYNFEANVREGLQGVYTLEPSWIIGRDRNWIHWFFSCLTEEDALGVGYAHVGQENNFLWENIRPGFAPQLDELKQLHSAGKIRVETMRDSARWFKQKYRLTPPMTMQASADWNKENNLSVQWYASSNYRVGILGEQGHLRIRDLFLYDESYESRYLHRPMAGTKSLFDALPVLFPQIWKGGERPFIRLMDTQGQEPVGEIRYKAINQLAATAELRNGESLTKFTMHPWGMEIQGENWLVFDRLPVFAHVKGNEIRMEHEGFSYGFTVTQGTILRAGKDGVEIAPVEGKMTLCFGDARQQVFTPEYIRNPEELDSVTTPAPVPKLEIPPFAPEFMPGDYVFRAGEQGTVTITCREDGIIRYTLDGSEPDKYSEIYREPLVLTKDTVITAKLFREDGKVSETARGVYRFCLTEAEIESPTKLDMRPVFHGNGLSDLLGGVRGTTDYIDGSWRGSLEGFDITCTLPEERKVQSIAMGFLSHHRSGIVYPESVTLYLDGEEYETQIIPNEAGKREIEKLDVVFQVEKPIRSFRIIAKRHARMPQWCAYRGTETVFTMADKLLITPGE